MPGTSPVILILGAGPNIGQTVGRTFASKGYKVALASRSLSEADSTDDQLNITSDFANPDDIVNAFAKVRKILGIPSVVVYNAAALTPSPPDDPFGIPLAGFNRDMAINTASAFVAAQQAVLGFAELPAHAARSFFFTGNILNTTILPSFMSAGAGKSASAHMMMAAAAAYKDRGYKFYYVDERKADGTAIFKVDGEAHGKLFWELAEANTQGPWLQTFVKGVGYKNFDSQYRL
ncbi:hypothetical protein BP6252_02972 [Coleophoma cylindrospora]|uniref:Short chain type dehydrogenase n=1 Tax=Coleophoma cylindrospora TaxID=1849047 RepID=A0A3D8S6M7_9HELO|nr:hypothetical protein BP6252_02972 [Coleophoma cylindrospora]